jgi:hypothetical protein
MDGVEPMVGGKPSGTPEQVTVSSSSNWKMALSFRKIDDSQNPSYELDLCTSYPCSTTGPISGSTLYLVDAGASNGNFTSDKTPYDNLNRLDYHIPNCNGKADATDSHCNHIKTLTVSGSGISITDASGTAVTATSFLCRAGACDVGFGPSTKK